MKILLPAVPAFLLCFAGGMLLPGKNETASVPAYLVLTLQETGGYEGWKKGMENRAKSAKLQKADSDAIEELDRQIKVFEAIKREIAEGEGILKEVDAQYEAAKNAKDAEKATLGQHRGDMKRALDSLKSLEQEIAKKAAATELPPGFENRLKMADDWVKAYKAAKGAFDDAKRAYDAAKSGTTGLGPSQGQPPGSSADGKEGPP